MVATTATAADTVEVEVEVETSPVASQDTRAEEDSCCITAEAPSFSDSAPAVAAVESEVPSEVAEAHAEKVASPTPKKKKKAEKTEKGLLTPKQEPSTQEKNKSAKATKVPKTPKFPPVDSDNAVPTAAATMSTDDAPTESAVATMVASPATKKAVKSTTKTAKGKTEPTPSRDAPTGQVEKGAEIARAGDATVSETVISDNTPVKSTKKSKNGKDTNGESAAAKKTPAKANPVISKSAEQGSDSTLDATPVRRVETADSDSKAKSNARGDLHIDTISAAVAVCTPQGGVGRNLVSPLVEFHSTYPSMEDEHATSAGAGRRDSGDDYGDDCDGDGSQLSQEQHRHNHLSSASRAHDINPMQQLSPLVEHHSIYPDLLLGEVEEQEEGVEGGGGVGGTEDTSSNVQQSTGEITPLGGGVGATSGAGSGSTKMHDINPMARASPGRGIIRIKLDMSQGEDSVLSPAAPQNGSPGDGEVVELAE